MELDQANQIRATIEAEIRKQLEALEVALKSTCSVHDYDVEFVQDMLKECDECLDCLCPETAYTTIRQAIINYLLDSQQNFDFLCEDLGLAVLETERSRICLQNQ